MEEEDKVAKLADDIGCSPGLARDLLTLAGGDEELVRMASKDAFRIETVKARIIDGRIARIEQ